VLVRLLCLDIPGTTTRVLLLGSEVVVVGVHDWSSTVSQSKVWVNME
jgi:hypothetical protein